MKKFSLGALSLALLLLPAFSQVPAAKPGSSQSQPQAQAKKSPLIPYAGNWIGTFENKPWLILNLNLIGEQFSGSLQHPQNFELNDNGELKKISENFVTETVVDGKLNPDGLLLTFKDSDTQETDRYMMKLTGDSTAELKMIAMTMPPGMPKPKPWKVTKQAAATPPKP
jgi:hypothetical protein